MSWQPLQCLLKLLANIQTLTLRYTRDDPLDGHLEPQAKMNLLLHTIFEPSVYDKIRCLYF